MTDDRALARMLDEHAITRLAARFYDAAMRGDVATFQRLFVPDGVWEITQPNPGRWVGREQIGEGLQAFTEINDFFFGATLPGVFRVEKDRALARFGVVELAARGDAPGYQNVGYYEDELVRDGDDWRFASRTYSYLWVDNAASFAGQSVTLPDRLTGPTAALNPDAPLASG